MSRYEKQLLLPEITSAHQEFLCNLKILTIGAGGLGASCLPYLAGAGIGHITIADHDNIDPTNLHRQTIYKDNDTGKSKALHAAEYLKALNRDINVTALTQKIDAQNAKNLCHGFDLILDGSDNFETKSLLNKISIETGTPLITASVEHFKGSIGIFAGFEHDAPCYHCLFPELPIDACDCNETGILGTVAGLAGLYQAHLTLCFLLGIGDINPGSVLSLDFKIMRSQLLKLQKNPECRICSKQSYGAKKPMTQQIQPIALIHPDDLDDSLIVDVRTHDEVSMDPIAGALHMQLDTIPARMHELPKDKRLAFACASNIRSRKAAEFLRAQGYDNVCIMDRLA